jgi:hypothetical protein
MKNTMTGELMTTGKSQVQTLKYLFEEAEENLSNMLARRTQKERGFKLR